MIKITTPLDESIISKLKAGDRVLLSGAVYTARDAAHARLVDLIKKGKKLPIDLAGQVIYYVGPTPAPKGRVIGSAGPTTSGRMDSFTPTLLDAGLKATIGKGERSKAVIDSMVKNKAVYFSATGGAAALLAHKIKSCEVIAYEELGCEAIHKLVVEDLPLIVINDVNGRDFYIENRKKYCTI